MRNLSHFLFKGEHWRSYVVGNKWWDHGMRLLYSVCYSWQNSSAFLLLLFVQVIRICEIPTLIFQNGILPYEAISTGKYSNNFVSPQRRRVSVRSLLKPEVNPEDEPGGRAQVGDGRLRYTHAHGGIATDNNVFSRRDLIRLWVVIQDSNMLTIGRRTFLKLVPRCSA